MLQTVACPACFGLMYVGSQHCPRCGARADAGVAPAQTQGRCPRCEGELKSILVAGTPLEQCSGCGGLWVGADVFDRICSDREAQSATLGINLPPPVLLEQGVRYLKCPRCSTIMSRLNYARYSGVVMDVCRPHGVWLDRDELRRIIEFIRAGGLDRARQAEKEEIKRERSQLESLRNLGVGHEGLSSAWSRDTYPAADILGGLAAVLRAMLR